MKKILSIFIVLLAQLFGTNLWAQNESASKILVGEANFKKIVAYIEKNGFVVKSQNCVSCSHQYTFFDKVGNRHAMITSKGDERISVWAYYKGIKDQAHFFAYETSKDAAFPSYKEDKYTQQHIGDIKQGYDDFLALVNSGKQVASQNAKTGSKVNWTPMTLEYEVNGVKKEEKVYWSDFLPGRYNNLDLDGTKPIDGIVQKSKATEACKNIQNKEVDGKKLVVTLPEKEDFEHSLTNDDFLKLADAKDDSYWSSTVDKENPDPKLPVAYGYQRKTNQTLVVADRSYELSVRCIGR